MSARVMDSSCVCLLLDEYSLPPDLELPKLAAANVVRYLAVERLTSSDLRVLRIYKTRGSGYTKGRQAFIVTSDGIASASSYQSQPEVQTPAQAEENATVAI